MSPAEAKEITDKVNEPLIKKFWDKNPLERYFQEIESIAKNGDYCLSLLIERKHYNYSVITDIHKKFQDELGYNVEVKYDDTKEEWTVDIFWV